MIYENECRYCRALKFRESNYRIDAKQSVIEIEFMCGTIVRVEIPGGTRWVRECSGSTSHRVENYLKLLDN